MCNSHKKNLFLIEALVLLIESSKMKSDTVNAVNVYLLQQCIGSLHDGKWRLGNTWVKGRKGAGKVSTLCIIIIIIIRVVPKIYHIFRMTKPKSFLYKICFSAEINKKHLNGEQNKEWYMYVQIKKNNGNNTCV